MKESYQGKHVEKSFVSETSPCVHCQSTTKCYSLANGLNVCISKRKPARGWKETGEVNGEGHKYYARKTSQTTQNNHKNSSQNVINNQANLEPVDMTGLPDVEETYNQKALDALFSDGHYIAINDQLYKWQANHYERCLEGRIRRKITKWCDSTAVEVKTGKYKYLYANSTCIENIHKYALRKFSVDLLEVNQGGLNCLNGILKIEWEGIKPVPKLIPHDPEKHLFTHVAEVDYNPFADDTDCNRMLEALEPDQQTIFLRTIAASLDLGRVRARHGRQIKALLMQGLGNNGKDTLREAVSVLFGQNMSSASLGDFQQYDKSEKFPLAKIANSKINWSSESSEYQYLDKLQGLKAAITGDPIHIEGKGKDEYEIKPQCVFLFNVNDPPLIEAGSEAIKSRWSIIEFKKTFSSDKNPAPGTLKADTRFKESPNFLKNHICSALLNRLLIELDNLMQFGIDHESVQKNLAKIQRESCHLADFAQDIGLVEQIGGRVYINDLWLKLKAWYLDTGALEIRDGRHIWYDQARASDRNIKAPNQIYKRFKSLFSKIEKMRHTERDNSDRMGQHYLLGLAVNAEAVAEARTQSYQAAEPAVANLGSLAKFRREWEEMDEATRLEIMSFLKSKQTNSGGVDKLGAAGSAADGIKDTASAVASAVASARPNLANSNGNVTGEKISPPLTIYCNNTIQNESTIESNINPDIDNQTSENQIHENRPIEYVRTKDDRILNIEHQEGKKLWGRQSEGKKKELVFIDQCKEIHYEEKEKESELMLEK